MGKKRVLILGSTGSIGTQALRVIEDQRDQFEVAGLIAGGNASLLLEQIGKFRPDFAGLSAPPEGFLPPTGVRWLSGPSALQQACAQQGMDMALVSVVGIVGLLSVLQLIDRGIPVLLANKEALVAGGALVMERARQRGVPILPVDSEHSAIFQCLEGRRNQGVRSLVLTASGGPFREKTLNQMQSAGLQDALAHPNWSMGKKITIDSATMMNKALEIIEAGMLFSVPADRIQVLVHKESIMHSAVEFIDGSVIAQMGRPDMRLPIAYAMGYPKRLPLSYERLDLAKVGALHFEEPDFDRFPALRLGYLALSQGGVAPAVLNGANEAAVQLFIEGKIGFLDIVRKVDMAMQAIENRPLTLENALWADREARRLVGNGR